MTQEKFQEEEQTALKIFPATISLKYSVKKKWIEILVKDDLSK